MLNEKENKEKTAEAVNRFMSNTELVNRWVKDTISRNHLFGMNDVDNEMVIFAEITTADHFNISLEELELRIEDCEGPEYEFVYWMTQGIIEKLEERVELEELYAQARQDQKDSRAEIQ